MKNGAAQQPFSVMDVIGWDPSPEASVYAGWEQSRLIPKGKEGLTQRGIHKASVQHCTRDLDEEEKWKKLQKDKNQSSPQN